jgi:hypothetical protein
MSDLADRIALALVPGPTSGSTLALAIRVRKSSVLHELRASPRFECSGRGRSCRWRLAPGAWEPISDDSGAWPDVDDVRAESEAAAA